MYKLPYAKLMQGTCLNIFSAVVNKLPFGMILIQILLVVALLFLELQINSLSSYPMKNSNILLFVL